MELTQYHKDIFSANICPYCGSKTKRTTESDVYGRTYRGSDVITCINYPKCDSYVGCHKDGRPLGRLANKDLRNAKVNAHVHFYKLWKSGWVKRDKAYQLLSLYLGIPSEYTHIGMFKVSTCNEVAEWAKDIYININRKD